jgi:hypothetical protein
LKTLGLRNSSPQNLDAKDLTGKILIPWHLGQLFAGWSFLQKDIDNSVYINYKDIKRNLGNVAPIAKTGRRPGP